MAKQAKRSKASSAGPRVKSKEPAARRRAPVADAGPSSMDMLKLQVNWPRRKQPVNLRIDSDIIDWFRRGGSGYQTRMNAVLRAFVDAQPKRR